MTSAENFTIKITVMYMILTPWLFETSNSNLLRLFLLTNSVLNFLCILVQTSLPKICNR